MAAPRYSPAAAATLARIAGELGTGVSLEEDARRARLLSSYEGQDAGVPGQGAPPILVHDPGGSVLRHLLHPVFTPFEFLRRIQPENGWFGAAVTPSHPVQTQIGSFGVPAGQLALVMDYEFAVYRPSGIDPGDFIRAANGRFSNQLGFDITVDGTRPANTSFQLVPQPAPVARQEFEPDVIVPGTGAGPAAAAAFRRAAASSYAGTAGTGTALLPARPNVLGPRSGPFTFIADEGAQVALSTVVFNRLRSPISCIEGRVAGFLIQTQVANAILNRVRPR